MRPNEWWTMALPHPPNNSPALADTPHCPSAEVGDGPMDCRRAVSGGGQITSCAPRVEISPPVWGCHHAGLEPPVTQSVGQAREWATRGGGGVYERGTNGRAGEEAEKRWIAGSAI